MFFQNILRLELKGKIMVQKILLGGFNEVVAKKKPFMAKIPGLEAQFIGRKCANCQSDIFCAHAVLGSIHYFLHSCVNLDCPRECFIQRENFSSDSCPFCGRKIERRQENDKN